MTQEEQEQQMEVHEFRLFKMPPAVQASLDGELWNQCEGVSSVCTFGFFLLTAQSFAFD